MNYTEKGTLILDGKTVAKDIQNSIKNRIDESNLEITLVTVLVGDDKPSQLYVNNKHKQAVSSSIKSLQVNLPGDISQSDLESKIKELGNDSSVNGILIQMPLPKGLNEKDVIETIIPKLLNILFQTFFYLWGHIIFIMFSQNSFS